MHLSQHFIFCAFFISTFATAYPKARHDLYVRDTFAEGYPELSLEKRDVHPRAGIQPSTGPHGISGLRRRGFGPPAFPLLKPRPRPSGPVPPNNNPHPKADMPQAFNPWHASTDQSQRGATNDLEVNQHATSPSKRPRQPHNLIPTTSTYPTPGTSKASPPPTITRVSGPHPPMDLNYLTPFSTAYRPGAGFLRWPRRPSNLNYLSPFSRSYRPSSPRTGGSKGSPKRRRSQILPSSRTPLDFTGPRSRLYGRVNFDPQSRMFTLHTRDAHPDANKHHLMPRGQNSKRTPPPNRQTVPSTPMPGGPRDSDDGESLPPAPPSSPLTPGPPSQSASRQSYRQAVLGSPLSSSTASDHEGSSPRSAVRPLPGSRNSPFLPHRPGPRPFLPLDPVLRDYILKNIPSQRPTPTSGKPSRRRPYVQGRRAKFRPFTGSI